MDGRTEAIALPLAPVLMRSVKSDDVCLSYSVNCGPFASSSK